MLKSSQVFICASIFWLGDSMHISKTVEITASSEKGFEDALSEAIKVASKSVRNIYRAEVTKMEVDIEGKKMVYKLTAKISFKVEHKK